MWVGRNVRGFMSSTKQHLFIYGSFLREAAPPAIRALCKRLSHVASATVKGALYDVDGYPALTLDDSDDLPVHGEVVSVGSASAWLRLDTYEGVDRLRTQRSPFRRVRTTAKTDTGERVECWVYVYNRDLSAARRIECGCWRTHLFQRDDVTVVPC
jgi:gamma-glutamylcyclotransferase (GGCT)/AIG2-like uncharacterized protein YtfP